jgi:hypothetical protein
VLDIGRGDGSPRAIAGGGAGRLVFRDIKAFVADLRGGADVVRADPDLRQAGLRTMALTTTGGGDDVLQGSDTDDTIVAGDGADELRGGAGTDVLRAGAGDDVVDGGAGADTLEGGVGADAMSCDAEDTVVRDDADTVTGACAAAGPPVVPAPPAVAPPVDEPPVAIVPPPAAPAPGAVRAGDGAPGGGSVRSAASAPSSSSVPVRTLRVRARAIRRGLSVTITGPHGRTVRVAARERVGRRTFRYAAVRRRIGARGRVTVTLRAPRALRKRGLAVVTVTDAATGKRIAARIRKPGRA